MFSVSNKQRFLCLKVTVIWRFVLVLLLVVVVVDADLLARSPNVLLLIADDLGYGDLSILGNQSLSTINIDRIGHEGAVLKHHLASASVCTPSRSAFLTGRYPVRSGMCSAGRNRVLLFVAASGGLPPTESTFARAFQAANYSTALFGKWHLGLDCSQAGDQCHHPNQHGFDYFFGLPLTNLKDYGNTGESVVLSYYPHFHLLLLITSLLGLCVGILLHLRHLSVLAIVLAVLSILLPGTLYLFQQSITIMNAVLYRNGQLIEQPVQFEGFTERLVGEAKDFIRTSQQNNKSFLVMVNFLKVHTAHFPSKPFKGQSNFGKYGDSVLELDHAVGQLLDLLEELGIKNDTLTYFSSDNGGHLEEVNREGLCEGGSNGPLRGGKGHGAIEGGIRVPSLVMWPRMIPAKQVVEVPTMQMDMFTTFHAIIGQNLPNTTIDGKNILPLLRGNNVETSPHQFMFHYCGTYLHAVRVVESKEFVWKVYYFTPKYKPGEDKCLFMCMCYGEHVISHQQSPLVYNIAQDISERNPLQPNDTQYIRVVELAQLAAKAHQKTLLPVESQFSLSNSIWKPWLQPCCSWPFCNCKS